MRILIPALIVVAFAGCMDGGDTPDFEASCPSWVKSPGIPGARIVSFDNATGTDFHLSGTVVHKPTLIDEEEANAADPKVVPLYEWDGALLDVIEFTPKGGAINGFYTLQVWRADMHTPHESDGQTVTYNVTHRNEQLGFRAYDSPGVLTRLELTPGDDDTFDSKTYRIELAGVHEDPRPGDLWMEYTFTPFDPAENAEGVLQTELTFWYRSC